MAAFEQDGAAELPVNFAGGFVQLFERGQFAAHENFGFGQVWRDQRCQRQEFFLQHPDRGGLQQYRAARSDHDGINDQRRTLPAGEEIGDGPNDSRRI
jgi:hypothetical protein